MSAGNSIKFTMKRPPMNQDGERSEKRVPTFKDLGGISDTLTDLKAKLDRSLCPGGAAFTDILLCGLPGAGKTSIGHAIGNEYTHVAFYMIHAAELSSGMGSYLFRILVIYWGWGASIR